MEIQVNVALYFFFAAKLLNKIVISVRVIVQYIPFFLCKKLSTIFKCDHEKFDSRFWGFREMLIAQIIAAFANDATEKKKIRKKTSGGTGCNGRIKYHISCLYIIYTYMQYIYIHIYTVY